jgi:hypothetical protein
MHGRRAIMSTTMHTKAAAVCRGSARNLGILVVGFLLFPAPLFAIITIAVQSAPGGRPVGGSGLPFVALNYGTVSAFEPLPAGVSRAMGASDYTLSTNFGVRVTKILSGSASYTLQARLQSAQPLTWRMNGVVLSTTATTVATLQPYATLIPHSLAFVVPFTHPAGLVSTGVEVIAIAN